MKKNNLIRTIKQTTAGLLAGAMVLTGAPLGNLTAQAATVLQPNTALNPSGSNSLVNNVGGWVYGSSNTTAFVYGRNSISGTINHTGTNSTGGGGTDTYTFNVGAILNDSDRENTSRGYYGSDAPTSGPAAEPTIKSAYMNNWWHGYYAFGTPWLLRSDMGAINNATNPVDPTNSWSGNEPTSASFTDVRHPLHTGAGHYNGEVQEITDGAKKVELRQEVKPTKDGGIVVEYTAYNPTNSVIDFMVGNETDTMIGGQDAVPIFVTQNGLHFQNSSSSYDSNGFGTVFDVKPAGITNRGGGDPSETRFWAGHWSMTANVAHTAWVFSQSKYGYINPGDSAAGFSAYFNLQPGETKTASFELSMLPAVIYVDPSATSSGNGFMGTPVKTIAEAMTRISQLSYTSKAYIYVQGDINLDDTVTVPTGKQVTITTADFDGAPSGVNYNTVGYVAAEPTPSTGKKKITRNPTKSDNSPNTGAMFKVTDPGSGLAFQNITIDGNGANVTAEAPIVDATAGTVKMLSGATLTNNKVSGDGASAIKVGGSAVLSLDGDNSNITKNFSTGSGSAVMIDSSADHPVTLNRGASITGNTSGEAATATAPSAKNPATGKLPGTVKNGNLKLGAKPLWVKSGDKYTGKVGINLDSANLPQTSEQATYIVDYEDRTSGGALPYSTSNFDPDGDGQHIVNATTADPATPVGGATGNQIAGALYLKTDMYDLSVTYQLPDGSSASFASMSWPGGGTNHVNTNPYLVSLSAGKEINLAMPTIAGYAYGSVDGTLPAGITNTNGSITGTMPTANTDIVIKLAKEEVRYKFDSNGGNTITDKTEPVQSGASIYTAADLPTPVRLGFVFAGWEKYNDVDNSGTYTTGDTDAGAFASFPSPSSIGTVLLYAKWTPDATQYPVTRSHKNMNATLPLDFGSDITNHSVTSNVSKTPVVIPGYEYNNVTVNPASIGTTAGNTINTTNGNVTIGSMPPRGIGINYRYKVDPSVTQPFTIKHVDAAGNNLVAPIVQQRRAEQPISSTPDTTITGYTYSTFSITQGGTSNLVAATATTTGQYIIGLDQPGMITANNTATGEFRGFMPNQAVTIEYKYTADAGMNLVRRYIDRLNNRIIASQVDAMNPGDTVNASIPALGTVEGDRLYGYAWDASSSVDLNPASSLIVAANGTLTGTMPLSGNGIRADYKLSRDASKWRDINFVVANTPNNSGSVDALPAGAPTSFLANDGSTAGNANAYTFDKLKNEGYVPSVTPNRYYKFDGWYLDAAATQQVNGPDTFPTVSPNAPLTLYAKFVEDPSQWFDINFAAGSNGSISAPATLHVPYDYTWSQVAALPSALLPTAQLPTATPVANYLFNGWKDSNGAFMQGTSTLTNHATYTAFFSQDPNVFGTIGSITPTGRIGNDGSGEIVIDGTTPGNVYVISDPNGNIVAVVPGDSTGNRTIVPNLIPGAHYNVQEGSPDTQATVGQPISSITGTSVSTPQDVYVPTVDNNYNIGYDPENDGMAQIVINPADPDADYALIDENGNVVQYPGSDNGWMTPVGNNPSTVTFNNLNPNETYTVVARKKGDSSIPNPLTKLPDGNQIIANPGDMADAPKYVVETKGGNVVTVGTTSVGNDTYDQAKAGEEVVIHADPVDANGKNFLYWQVLAGRAVGVSGNITQADYSFTLSNSNIVLKAVYEPTKVAGDDADLTETIRGGGVGEFGLTPGQIPGLAHDLTTPLDRSLIGVNGATVEYKVVFNKRDAKPNEKTAVKPVSVSGVDHPDAHTTAYGLDIQLERYVNGRLVNNGILATASNATVDVIAQLPAEDVDQLDYQLFDVTPDSLGNINPVDITITTDVANNAGLLKFTGNLQHSYVLVYSKTFKVTFVDNKPVLDHLHLNDTSRNFYKKFKVRRKENVEDAYYSSDYAVVTAYAQNDVANGLVTPFEDIYGVQYDYVNWSKKEDKLSVYDTTSPVTKRTIVYAYYSDNRKEVAKARVDLGDTIEEAKILTGDPYLKVAEVAELNEAIAHAVETLRQARDLVSPDGTTYLRQANYAELQQAIDALRRLIDKYSKIAADRAGDRNRRTGGASGGGNSSSGRGSRLLTPGEKSQQNTAINENSNVRAFVLGVDGAWETNPVTGGWSFVLNGGTPLNDMWGMITFNDNTGKKVSRWYYFDGRSTMATGWVYDSKNGNWYYMNTTPGPELGQMVLGWVKDEKTNKWYYMNDNTGILKTGWHKDPQDGRWYYLNSNGEMLVGWQNIGGKWYYFNTNTPQNTYTWDANAFKWNYLNNSVRPFGSMYAGEKTPDGYNVDANGAWY